MRAILAESNIAVVPILPSIFDEMATLKFLKRLEAIKSVRKQKKCVMLVANRYRADRSASRRLEEFLVTEGLLLTARIPSARSIPTWRATASPSSTVTTRLRSSSSKPGCRLCAPSKRPGQWRADGFPSL